MAERRAQRRLAAILAADVVGYSRLMQQDEAGTLAALKTRRSEVLQPLVSKHNGRIVKLMGDGVLVEFPSAVNAVACAVELQAAMDSANTNVNEDRRIVLRVGVNLGDVMVEGSDLYGDGVNIAARLEAVAEPGRVLVSQTVYNHVRAKVPFEFEDLGERTLKNIAEPVRVYTVDPTASGGEAPTAGTAEGARRSIAVLPFVNMSGDPEQEYFSDGITEDIITDLSKISGLFVVARNSVFTLKGKPLKAQQASRELGAAFILEGSVRKAGARVRITAQLINGKDGGHLWAERYDRDLTDIFAIQDEITHTIVEQLRVKLLPAERQALGQAPTANMEAYTLYLRGRELFRSHTKTTLTRARTLFASAAELDPHYARAYAGMADCDSMLYAFHGASVSLDSVLDICDRALTLDPDLAEAHASRGLILGSSGQHKEAVAEFERAIALDPSCYEGHYLYARASFMRGDFEKAVEHYARATEIRPDDYRSPLMVMNALHSLGRSDEEAKYANLGLERAERALRLHPENSDPAQLGACALAVLGQRERAKEWMDRVLAIDPDDQNALYNVACAYSLLGESVQAIEILERILPKFSSDFRKWIKQDSDLDPIRTHPRYGKLVNLIE
jgi:adenylate cyclase